MSFNNRVHTPYVALHQDTGASDAFARLRVANPGTLFDSKQLYDKKPLFWDEVITDNSGNATSTHSTTDADVDMYVEATDTIVRQTKTHWNYQPGKSQLAVFTASLTTASNLTGVKARVGLFTATDGLFFESDSNTLNVCVRKASSDTAVAQSKWNRDTFDGSGSIANPSGLQLDPAKGQILFIDYEWLALGRIRYGFFVNGVPHVCHVVENFNQLDSAYMSTPNLPVRYEISSAAGGSSATLKHICTTVIAEGGMEENGVIHTISSGATGLSAATSGTIYGVFGVRLKSTHLDLMAKPTTISMLATTANDEFEWLLLMNPTVAGTPTFSSEPNTGMDVAVGATANTVTANSEDIHMAGGFATTSQPIATPVTTAVHWGSLIDGTPDEIWLCVRPLQNSTTIHATMSWRELV